MKIVSMPFSFRGEGYLGKIYRPYLKILTKSPYIDRWIPIETIVDTGADYTLLPKRYASLLRLDIKRDCRFAATFGVGGEEGVYLCKNVVRIKINDWDQPIPVGFLQRDNIPALLGRLDCLEKLGLVMKDFTTILEG